MLNSDTHLSPEQIITRFLAAAICGLLVGIDRDIKSKPAGIRTYMLVCLGSCAFTLMVFEISEFYIKNYANVSVDPTRVIQGIITGIGFLGGGAILSSTKENKVKGLTTGASIWIAGAIGLSCGYGFYIHALILTTMTVMILTIAGFIKHKIFDED